jgi:hypothetical protein
VQVRDKRNADMILVWKNEYLDLAYRTKRKVRFDLTRDWSAFVIKDIGLLLFLILLSGLTEIRRDFFETSLIEST